MKINIKAFGIILIGLTLNGCHNKDILFDNYEFQSVYFSYQHPIRTLTMGEDIVNTDLDNAHKCMIYATLGGVYKNNKIVKINCEVDNDLVRGVSFADGSAATAMPPDYYHLASNTIEIAKDSISGGVEVQLTDAFFEDPDAIKNKYVLPLKMTGVSGADSILADKNYTLYAIKYINTWHGYYLRRGIDVIKGNNGNTSLDATNIRHQQYVEKDDVQQITTRSLTTAVLPLIFKDKNGYNVNCNLILDFDDEGNCTIESGTAGITATGTGKFVKKGEKQSWGNKDRDALYLDYEVNMADEHVATLDTLVMRNRGVTLETF